MATASDFGRLQTSDNAAAAAIDWRQVAYKCLLSRAVDKLEEERLLKEKKILYQFSARGHELGQVLLGQLLDHRHDAASGYYRSRPFMLSLGLALEDAIAGPMMRSGSFSDGRDIGVVYNMPGHDAATVLPMSGGVGAQYTPVAGWAQSIFYHRDTLQDESWRGALAVALGGDASVATNGFWSALTIATTLQLPMLFFIEDNGYGISVTSDMQTPGRNIAANLESFSGLAIFDGDGTEARDAANAIASAIGQIRAGGGPALVRLTVPRLCGHSGQDTQAYKSEEQIAAERARDPLPKLRRFLVPNSLTATEWRDLENRANADVEGALESALARPLPDPAGITRFVFSERDERGDIVMQQQGGLGPSGHDFGPATAEVATEPGRINLVTAVRRTLDAELALNARMMVFGEDVAAKGGVHAVTLGLAEKHGYDRVFDTSLSEEGIIGRSLGMAAAGLLPVPELQFRKYADPAEEQLNDCGTMRWRTANRFAAPMVVRVAGGFFKCGDPWHSQCNEVKWVHATGWQVAMPSNAEDAVGLLRFALRDNNPTIFFEHRNLLDLAWARRPYPGDDYVVPFGKAATLRQGSEISVITWGAMVPRCEAALQRVEADAELIDLRTLSPWDDEAVLESVRRTRRCLIVHEDTRTAGFGAEIAARVADECFFDLDAPVRRLAVADVPSPHSPLLLDAVVPGEEDIAAAIGALCQV
ncbi:MAG: transketolase C-terminal domain-containing protein [Chromatiales bacterium]|jgi:2-oxoisovalerate dehydrogenase E1 component